MGKYAILITIAVLAGTTMMMYQSDQTSLDTDTRQAERQTKVIARQVARTGYNAVLGEARVESNSGKELSEVVASVGTITGEYEGGTYEAWLHQISPTAFRAKAIGTVPFMDGEITHEIGQEYDDNTMTLETTPMVEKPSTLTVRFKESLAGYCSAIYLQRILPNVEPENQPDPELVFAPGNNRDGASTNFERTIVPGTKLNFILAVDADYSCERRGDESVPVDSDFYSYVRNSFTQDVSQIQTVHEAPYALMQEAGGGGWRIAFEDLVFEPEQLWDIKENGYPNRDGGWDSEAKTYGGDGWDAASDGLYDLKDYGNLPDFSDQVIDVGIKTEDSGGSVPETFVESTNGSAVTVSSTKDLSNVIWQRADGSWQKREGLSGHTMTIPHSADNPITDVWIKSGSNFTGGDAPSAPSGGSGEYHSVPSL